jgi:hypothetical protein
MNELATERASGRDVILAIGENMRQSLEPLVTKVIAPSLYQVYLHADDFDHLRTLFNELEAEAKKLLDNELDRLNRGTVPPLARLLSPLRKKNAEGPAAPRYVSAEGRWVVRFQEDPNGLLEPGDVQVVSEFARGPAEDYGAGSLTSRISTTRRFGKGTVERTTLGPQAAYAKISYQDDGGARSYLMTKDEIVIGREAPDVWVDLRLETSLDVSREHARLKRTGDGAFQIKDLSKLGTTVNRTPLPRSLETVAGQIRDLERWVDLPDKSRIGLAGVVHLEFEKL